MKGGILGKVESPKLGCGAMVKCLLFAVIVLSVLNPAVMPHSVFLRKDAKKQPLIFEEKPNLDLFKRDADRETKLSFRLLAKELNQADTTENAYQEDNDHDISTRVEISKPSWYASSEKSGENDPVTHLEVQPTEEKENKEANSFVSFNESEKSGENKSKIESDEKLQKHASVSSNEKQEQRPSVSSNVTLDTQSKLTYNFTNPRYNICTIEGDIRILPNALTIFVISPVPLDPNTSTWKIKPYPRKWEAHTMETISEMTIKQVSDARQVGSCDVTHDVPAVVFSSARFMGNLFHDYTDMIYPLFLASHRYKGEVKLVVEDYASKAIEKYKPYFTRLSHYPIINLDNGTLVHCFSSARIGLENPGPLGYEFKNTGNDHSMQEFTQFIRYSLSLKRDQVLPTKKPRLLILLRKWTRSIVNEQDVIKLAEDIGFEVVTADTDTTKEYPKIAHIVNSCDILMGIHGAGLANMLYLPTNGTVLQIIPWGELKWVGRFDYGDPPRGFGLKYVEYEITQDESTLIEKYPRDHRVFTDPQSYHNEGWQAVYLVYLHEQSVRLDVNRFRGTLEEVFQSYQK